jgi:hypothetical protein
MKGKFQGSQRLRGRDLKPHAGCFQGRKRRRTSVQGSPTNIASYLLTACPLHERGGVRRGVGPGTDSHRVRSHIGWMKLAPEIGREATFISGVKPRLPEALFLALLPSRPPSYEIGESANAARRQRLRIQAGSFFRRLRLEGDHSLYEHIRWDGIARRGGWHAVRAWVKDALGQRRPEHQRKV